MCFQGIYFKDFGYNETLCLTFQAKDQHNQRSCFSQLYLFPLNNVCNHNHRGLPQSILLKLTTNSALAFLFLTGRFSSGIIICPFQTPGSSSLDFFQSYYTLHSIHIWYTQ